MSITVILSILTYVSQKIFDTGLSKGAGEVLERLSDRMWGDERENSFKLALAEALFKYSHSKPGRIRMFRHLLNEQSFLLEDEVCDELRRLITHDREPDPALIAERWRASFHSPPPDVDFTAEARALVGILAGVLKEKEDFHSTFQTKSLDAVAAELASIKSLLEARLGELLSAFWSAPAGVQQWIRDESLIIHNKTSDFVGRRFVFDAVDKFIEESGRHSAGSGYFIIQGDPGIGKTALAAELVKDKGCVHHFNRRSVGQNTPEMFLGNVCAQLIARYGLKYSALPARATSDGGFFDGLLKEVAEMTPPGEHVLLVVDALDEVDMTRQSQGANALYLPDSLPPRIYFVLTRRRLETESLRVAGRIKILNIEHDQEENKADIRDYLRRVAERPSIREYILERGMSADEFVSILEHKSEGNFIYLYYVCLDIENGRYGDSQLAALPEGLENYYESHWRLIKSRSDDEWFAHKLPVLFVLAEAEVALSVRVISQYADKEGETPRVVSVLEEWGQFLHIEESAAARPGSRLYSIYHASFRDFIYRKIQESKVNADVLERMQGSTTDFFKSIMGFND